MEENLERGSGYPLAGWLDARPPDQPDQAIGISVKKATIVDADICACSSPHTGLFCWLRFVASGPQAAIRENPRAKFRRRATDRDHSS